MKTKNLIIGGGFAGLYLAAILNEAVLVEATPSVGGLLQGFKSKSGNFTFDVGGHVYTTKDAALAALMSGSDAVKFDERKAYFDYVKKVPYPLQYFADQIGIPVCPSPKDYYPSFGSMLHHEFGKEFYEKVLKPFNQRVWSTNPNAMDTDWVMGRVPLMKDIQSFWGPNSSFYYARGEDILEFLLNRMTEVKIYTDTWVTKVDKPNKIAYVECREPAVYKGIIEYENLFDTSGLLLSSMVQLPHNYVTSIGIGLNKKIDEDFHWWYNGINASPIHRITLLSRYHPKMAPSGCDSLLLEIPRRSWMNEGSYVEQKGEAKTSGVLSILRDAGFLFIDEKDVEETIVIESKGYPIPVIGHRAKVAKARRKMEKQSIFLVGRWGAHGYYNLDHVIRDAHQARLSSLGMESEDYYWANYYYKQQRRFE